jgi:hypothetical protein
MDAHMVEPSNLRFVLTSAASKWSGRTAPPLEIVRQNAAHGFGAGLSILTSVPIEDSKRILRDPHADRRIVARGRPATPFSGKRSLTWLRLDLNR